MTAVEVIIPEEMVIAQPKPGRWEALLQSYANLDPGILPTNPYMLPDITIEMDRGGERLTPDIDIDLDSVMGNVVVPLAFAAFAFVVLRSEGGQLHSLPDIVKGGFIAGMGLYGKYLATDPSR